MKTLTEAASVVLENWLATQNATEHWKSIYRRLAIPSISIENVSRANSLPVGASKIGGYPDLPLDVSWPESHLNGHAMTFLGQFNLAELPVATRLPKTGWLSVFLDIDEPSYNIKNRVLYFPESTELTERVFPLGLTSAVDVGDPKNIFTQCTFSYEISIDFPTGGKTFDSLSEEERDDVIASVAENGAGFFGCHYAWAGDARRDAYLFSTGQESMQWDYPSNPDWTENENKHLEQIENWMILLKLGSHDEAGMCWWDAGFLEFVIHSDKLDDLDFSETYCNLATS